MVRANPMKLVGRPDFENNAFRCHGLNPDNTGCFSQSQPEIGYRECESQNPIKSRLVKALCWFPNPASEFRCAPPWR